MDPAFDVSVTTFVHDMLKHLYGVPDMVAFTPVGGGPNRYADSFRGQSDGHDFVVTNVSFTVSHRRGGEQPLVGSVCVMGIGSLLPLALVQPRNCEPFMRAMTKEVQLGSADFEQRFHARSGHADYAIELLTPMIDDLVRREDWALYLEFANLVSLPPRPSSDRRAPFMNGLSHAHDHTRSS